MEINWTKNAREDLQKIYNYISEVNVDAANKTVDGIFEITQLLEKNPEMGYKHDTKSELNVRIIIFGHYKIPYLVKSKTRIDILTVFHGAMKVTDFFR